MGNRAADEGGAVDMNGDELFGLEFINCTFEENEAYEGGAIYVYEATRLINCTLVNNHADFGGALYGRGSSLVMTIINSIIWGNTGDSQIYEFTGSARPHHSNIDQDGYILPGAGNIRMDPAFEAGSLALSASSPCIDAGDNGFALQTTDLGGSPRIVDGDGRGSDEARCPCAPGQFLCSGGGCIEASLLCDENDDCGDGSDEFDCECGAGFFMCQSGACIEGALLCDGNEDCGDSAATVDMGAYEYQP